MPLLVRAAAAAAIAAAVAASCPAPGNALDTAGPVSGPARVLDGDTLEIGGTRVRLYGIDAPEKAQSCIDARRRRWPCGMRATQRLESMIGGRTVVCRGRERDRYGRFLGICSVERDELNAALVREGLAWAFVAYAADYVGAEREGRATKRGVFGADNIPPWEFRKARWSAADAEEVGGCPIKGNIARAGERIYHLPWQRHYAKVRIDATAGERWFCDEAEAERAGFRRAQQ
jgi:endonuclease YncB( thermonuclease family)